MHRAVHFLMGCGLLMAAEAAVMPSSAPALLSSVRTPSMNLRGGADEKKGMKRVMSHENIETDTHGTEDTLEARYFAKAEGEHRSLWHDLPLFESDLETGKPTGSLNFVCEIPKWTRKKFELATKEALNPIKQDEKKGQLRSFKKGDIYFNYGCFPRTWEDPDYSHPDVKVGGDNDPLDVCEIGLRQIPTGKVRPVKVLGILCMIDEGEADWKVVAIDREDPWAEKLKDIDDVQRHIPGLLDAIREWFRTYKIPDGKPANEFALGEQFMNRAYALGVVHETHRAWARLVQGNAEEEGLNKSETEAPAPEAAKAAGKKKFTMKRNLSVPALDALKQVEGSMLSDDSALAAAMAKAKVE
jgi:inorganic pyrophosphatase